MKKAIALAVSVILLLSLTLTGCAAEGTDSITEDATELILQIGKPTMLVNGIEKPIDAEGTVPVIVQNRTLLPVRAVIEELGGTVQWNGDTQTVTLTCGEDEIRLTIDDTAAYINGVAQTLDVPPTLINDRTMLPIRFIAEGFRLAVSWNQAAQTVTITKAALSAAQPPVTEPTATPAEPGSQSLIVYFSATGTTKTLAETIAETAGIEIMEIVPTVPYTSADLNYNSDCRANAEQQDDTARPALEPLAVDWDAYDTIFIGYPIWHGQAPKIIYTFLENYDFSGKIIVPFCTSASSGVGSSATNLHSICNGSNVTWKPGFRFSSSASDSNIESWLNGLDLPLQ